MPSYKTALLSEGAQREQCLLKDFSRPPPGIFFYLGVWFLALVEKLKACFVPQLQLFYILLGFMRSQVLYTVAALDIADALKDGPMTADEVAKAVGADPDRLFRVMRAAVQFGLFTAEMTRGAVRFRNNRMSAMLRECHPNCQKFMVMHQVEDNKPAWDELLWGTRTGGAMYEKTHSGLSSFAFYRAHPEQERKFSLAMASVDSLAVHAIITDYNWRDFTRLLDVGGAYGSFLAKLLVHHPHAQGLLFDQPQVVERARGVWAEDELLASLRERVRFISGDFFKAETLPMVQNGDGIILRLILHDWSDADCGHILANLRVAFGGAAARLLIVETILRNEFDDPLFQRGLLDVHMMACLGGAERAPTHWRTLLESAGFRLARVVATRSPFSIVEAVPA